MLYFYHGVPDDMRGSKLVPLNEMLGLDSQLQAKYLEKYKGREEVLNRKIPLLDCLWNDVVQLLPLHPRQLFELQKELGLIHEIPNYRYFQIDPSTLDSQQAVVYFKTAPGDENITVKWLKDVDLEELQVVPRATRNYYESMIDAERPVFNYQFVPHVMYKGSVDVSGVRIIGIDKLEGEC